MKVSRSPIILAALLGALFPSLVLHAEPQWIWSQQRAYDKEKEIFRKKFTITGEIKSATLALTCDNAATATLNGKTVLENLDWNEPVRGNVAKNLHPGENELVIEGRNREGAAALLASLTIETADGKKQLVETGPDWETAKPGTTDFHPVLVIAKYGAKPWGAIFDRTPKTAIADPASLTVAPGFKVELLYTVPKEEQGSWVALTVDPKGRLLASDQYGGIYRITPPPIGQSGEAKVEPLATQIGGAHGLLFANNALYVMVNETKASNSHEAGLYRLKYNAAADAFETPELLRHIQGGGEHGPHSIVLGPDGKSIYICAGNFTKFPEGGETTRPVAWQEDNLLPRLWDANGFGKALLAPGGYTCKLDFDGKNAEIIAFGFRNHFDMAFDTNGELFTYDSDMEWDMGSPWYVPTRINHIVSGGDFGWRSGANRMPAYYEDSLPAVLDIGPGSPTGMVFGTGAKFPAKYQRAMFALDWTYGTLYAIHYIPDGATFRAEKEEFVAGKPLPLTDVVIRPQDGALYFTVGGRKTQSALFRVTYTGSESTAPVLALPPTPEAKTRRELEKLHVEGVGPEAIDKAWPHLASPDRYIRWAARVAIEHQPVAKWKDRALAERDPWGSIEALIALSRMGCSKHATELETEEALKKGTSSGPVVATLPEDAALQKSVLEALGRLDFKKLDKAQQMALLRAYELCFTRLGKPGPDICAPLAAKFDPLFPQTDALMNRELVSLLVFLDSTSVVAKTVPLLDTTPDYGGAIATEGLLARNEGYAHGVNAVGDSRPNRQAIAYVYALRDAHVGWTPALRKAYFTWFSRTRGWHGGNSFTKFLENMRTESLANFVPDAEHASLDALSKQAPPAPPANIVMPKGPGRNYSVDEAVAFAQGGLHGRNFEQGKAMFTSTLCIRCHHFNGEGGNIGPDISGAGNRYTLRDLLENIIEPSKVISDQYGTDQLELKDGSTVIGRVVVEENEKLFVMTSALAPETLTPVNARDVKARKPYPVSMMPVGLINGLNKDELLDLLAYIQSGGNPNDKAFAR
ncbi:heme-binding protein [Chthoniobacter flavus Ellin428]|uniref:Heme-binding protein n=1 Tax=Chthoniobacter flavus Ellin428 TaxID=497964 RepID=B4CZ35_9BACT|nr:c-type cytochrome [Chthoniobacter flavus]EDY20726.1 heme-binding protein [Chthoniobacter flavus Ellin428]TCO89621.1 putative heme-binding domain-containing protein [Chthoniobacter flavus]